MDIRKGGRFSFFFSDMINFLIQCIILGIGKQLMTEFFLHVDESGCEGFKFDRGSFPWHIVSGVLTRARQRDEVLSAITDYQDIYYTQQNMPLPEKPPHWVDMSNDARHIWASEINKKPILLWLFGKQNSTGLNLLISRGIYTDTQ